MQAYASALHDGTPKTVASRYTNEGELQLPDLAPLHGRKAIMDFLTPLESTSQISSVKMHTDWLEVHGPIAAQAGTYDQDAGERGKPPEHFHGRYLATWRLEADGVWRLSRLMMQPLKGDLPH
jgi:ketosteroid isomerase-like protein